MRHIILRRSTAVILTVVLLFTTVFSVSMFASAASSYSPRLSAPSSDNAYYYSNKNLFYKYGYGMPNCTAYAYGRAYEITKKEPKLCPYNAEEWFDYNKTNGYYDYGTTPKLGAIACWYYNGGGGHVAVVEKIENGTITFSNSAYSGTNFYTNTASVSDSNAGGPSWWNFQGYIYIIDGDAVAPTTNYEPGVHKVNEAVNMRSGAGTGYSVVTTVPAGQKLTVTEVKSANDYHWGKTSYNGKTGWVALEFCTFVSAIYNAGVYKTNVSDSLNMRSGAGTSYSWVTSVPGGVKLNVTSVEEADGYHWGKTSYDGKSGWVALEFCKYVSTLPSASPTPTEPTTVAPTTTAPTTVAPTTAPPTTVAPTTVPPTTKPEVTKPQGLGTGDVNSDGSIDVQDATLIQKHLAGLGKLTDEQIKYCDFNFDGQVTVADSTGIQKYLIYMGK